MKKDDMSRLEDILKYIEVEGKFREIKKNLQVEHLAKDYLNDNGKLKDLHSEIIESVVNIEAEAFLVSKTFEGIERVLNFAEFKANFVSEVVKQYREYHKKELYDWLNHPGTLEFFDKMLSN